MDYLRSNYILGLAAIAICALIIYLISRWIRAAELNLKTVLKNRKNFEAVNTDSPVDDPFKLAKKRGLVNIEERFKKMRWLLFGITILLTIFVVAPLVFNIIPNSFSSLAVGIFTVVVGIAARPYLENVIAGLVVATSKVVKVGDTVRVDGRYGTVEEINLTYTIVKIWDWTRFVVPNHKMLQKEFENLSLFDKFIWTKVEFFVSPQTDLEKVERLASEAMANSKFFSNYEPPNFWVMGLEKDATCCWVAGWADSPSDAWSLSHDVRMKLSKKLQNENVATQNVSVSTNVIGNNFSLQQ